MKLKVESQSVYTLAKPPGFALTPVSLQWCCALRFEHDMGAIVPLPLHHQQLMIKCEGLTKVLSFCTEV